ncbi:MAG: XrtA system polysaccharide deacetylase [Pseudomonadota bacterium]
MLKRDTSQKPRGKSSFALTVDVEDYFQVWAFSSVIPVSSWGEYSLRVERSTDRILEMLDEADVRATFFVLGWVADRAPQLVRRIAAEAHEIASHGYGHQKISDQTQDEFFTDVTRSKNTLEDITGQSVLGYRAPSFSIKPTDLWVYRALTEAGYRYSSSRHPIAHDHYGDPTGPQTPFRPRRDSALIEAPIATASFGKRRLSAGGGGWFRAAPYPVSRALLRRASAANGGPSVFYFHPWEVDPDQPRVRKAPLKSQLRHYLNLSKNPQKLGKLFGDFPWGRLDDALGLQGNTQKSADFKSDPIAQCAL